jgi:hypothetical protein
MRRQFVAHFTPKIGRNLQELQQIDGALFCGASCNIAAVGVIFNN